MEMNAAITPRKHSVRAMFEDGMTTFLLSYDATFEELAGCIGRIAEQNRTRPLSVAVKMNPAH